MGIGLCRKTIYYGGSKMTVKELIEFLQEQPQDIQVSYRCCSESCLLESHEICVVEQCIERPDGWIQNARPDKPTKKYLEFPGN